MGPSLTNLIPSLYATLRVGPTKYGLGQYGRVPKLHRLLALFSMGLPYLLKILLSFIFVSSDFENKFVCGEIMAFGDLKEHGSEAAVKAAGKLRQQGKPYESMCASSRSSFKIAQSIGSD